MRYFLSILILLSQMNAGAQHFLKTSGKKVVDENGNNVLLRGMGLGGWMLQEPYMLQLSGTVHTQGEIRKKITELVGEKKTNRFYEEWLANHCTRTDIDSLAAWGFNSVRLPLHYGLFTLPVDKEPDRSSNTWLSKGFELTDSVLSWCKANHIYLILDLHAAPGGQGNDVAIADRDSSKPSLWQDEANKQKTIALWTKLSRRYAGEEWIGGYDIINETNWGFENEKDKNGLAEKSNVPLRKLLIDISNAIRQEDKKHMIIIEGNGWANNYAGLFPLWDDNMVISFHKYWNVNNQGSIQNFLNYRDKYNAPLWLGETGENSNAWITDAISLLERNNIGWCMWPLKKSGLNNPFQVPIPAGFKAISDYWKGKGSKPSAKKAYEGLLAFARATNANNNIVHLGFADAMIRQVKSDAVIPFKENIIQPGAIIFAADYDMGRAGISYHDKDSAEYWVSTTVRTPWNTGGQYRNDGVDIEVCKDQISNGYDVGWIEDGEWLQYSVYSPGDAVYDVNVRTAAKAAGNLQLIMNGNFVGSTTSVPVTGAFTKWETSSIKNIKLSRGWNTLRVLAVKGGFNFNYLQFNSTDNAVGNGSK